MTPKPAHTIHAHQHHLGWDNSIPPVLTIAPGATLTFDCRDASDGQFTPTSTAADIASLDLGRINPVNGPILIDGAQPGDAIKVTIHAFDPSGHGWTANIPGLGLLASQFPDPALHLWSYDRSLAIPAAFSPIGRVPLKPFPGTIGLALAEPGLHSIVPPRRTGGNMDIRDISEGTILYLPVEVAGGLFSIGDPHAAQGDGEICGSAIESAMSITLTLDLAPNANLASPRFTTPGPTSGHLDTHGYEVTTGIGPDLMTAAREAVSRMIDLLTRTHAMAAVEAYMLCSVCGDLRISEIVDLPNWVVAFYFPRVVLS